MRNNNSVEDNARSSQAAGVASFNQEMLPPIERKTTCACKPSPLVFWAVAGVSWLTFWPVAVLITLGNEWLREDDGERLDWFKIGGTSELLRSCQLDDDVLSGEWCDKFKAFSVIQAVATLSFAVVVLMLMIALFWTTPRPWSIAAGTLLMLFTIMQAIVVVLVAMMKADIDEASAPADSSGSVTTSDSGSATTSTNEYTFLPLPEELEYGVTFYLALYGAIITFNESLLLCALAEYSGEGPWRGVFGCKACKLAEIGYTPPAGMFEMQHPSAAPVYPTRADTHNHSP